MRKHKLNPGLVQVYTGDGKGKTTAAIGLALRAAGRGLKVFIIQFLKGGFDYGELRLLEQLPNIEVRAFGRGRFITSSGPSQEDIEEARKAMDLAREVIMGGEYDVVILDEVNVAIYFGLVSLDEVLELIRERPRHVELILTGRKAPEALIEVADLVTEMREVKHPYRRGMPPRPGIEF
ncbi:MAG TPA: cob(I)yrinic acid a,c-diamide adenosyltransferase [Candidatus Bathyarchaeota archaeon]|nr:cob(I)yrinic acid a,c-diamide adenosyltransferase [Candidatus Bathyarchaeota archaeon]